MSESLYQLADRPSLRSHLAENTQPVEGQGLAKAVAWILRQYGGETKHEGGNASSAYTDGDKAGGVNLQQIAAQFAILEELSTSSSRQELLRYRQLLETRADWFEAALEETIKELERIDRFLQQQGVER